MKITTASTTWSVWIFATMLSMAQAQDKGQLQPLSTVTDGLPDLEIIRPPADPAALEQWLGDPKERAIQEVFEKVMHPAGEAILTTHGNGPHKMLIGIWERVPASLRFQHSRFLRLSPPWNISPDGKYLFGCAPGERERVRAFGVYDYATGKALWRGSPDHPAMIIAAAFSRDSRLTAVIWRVGSLSRLSLLETSTGKPLKEQPIMSASDTLPTRSGALIFGKESLFVSPGMDEEGRVLEISLKDGTQRYHPTANPTDDDGGDWPGKTRMGLSEDGRYLAIYENARVLLMENRGGEWKSKFRGEADFVNWLGGDGFDTVAFSPDSRQLLISGNDKFRVIDPATGKTIQQSTSTCRCGVFHPKGRAFIRTCAPFEVVDPGTWQPLRNGAPIGATRPITGIDIGPDGKSAVITSWTEATVWALPDNEPAKAMATLIVKEPESHLLTRVNWIAAAGEYQGCDGLDFFRWRLPQGGPAPAPIIGQLAFPGRDEDREMMSEGVVIPDTSGKNALYYNASGPWVMRSLTPGAADSTARRLKFPVLFDVPGDTRAYFHPGDRKFIYDSMDGTAVYDLDTDAITPKKMRLPGRMAGYHAASNLIVSLDFDEVRAYDATALTKLWTLPLNGVCKVAMSPCCGVSPDGHWLVTATLDPVTQQSGILLVDLTKKTIVAQQDVYWDIDEGLAFTPDSTKVVVGHRGGAASVWNLAKLAATPQKKVIPSPITQTSKTSSRPAALRNVLTEMPTEPLHPDGISAWKFSPTGAVDIADGALNAGEWLIDGTPLRVLKVSAYEPRDGAAWAAGIELCDNNQQSRLQVRRTLSTFPSGSVGWVDEMENLTSSPVQIEAVMVAGFNRDWKELEAGSREPLTLEGGQLKLPEGYSTIASAVSSGLERRINVFQPFLIGDQDPATLKDPTGLQIPEKIPPPMQPELRWDDQAKRILCTYHLNLAPYERRVFLHKARSTALKPDEDLNKELRGTSLTTTVQDQPLFEPERLKEAVNFATPSAVYLTAITQPSAKPRPPIKEKSGFTWTIGHHPPEIANELMLNRCFVTQIDGWPVTISGRATQKGFRTRSNDRLGNSAVEFDYSVDLDGVYRLCLSVQNETGSPVERQVRLIALLKKPVSRIATANGKTLPQGTELNVAETGGTFALIADDSDATAALFAIGKPGASVTPKVTLIDAKTLEIAYTLTLAPGASVVLSQFAGQRPFAAFASEADAFANWPASKALQAWEASATAKSANWNPPP